MAGARRVSAFYERTTIRPALSINGITGGYQGSGAKAVIPAHATAKLNFRLVPDAGSGRNRCLVAPPRGANRAADRCGETAHTVSRQTLRVAPRPPGRAGRGAALRKGFGAEAEFLRIGGTIPVAHLLQDELGIATVPLGFALPDDGLHAPNERFRLANFFQAIDTSIHLLGELAAADGAAGRNRAPVWHLNADEFARPARAGDRR